MAHKLVIQSTLTRRCAATSPRLEVVNTMCGTSEPSGDGAAHLQSALLAGTCRLSPLSRVHGFA